MKATYISESVSCLSFTKFGTIVLTFMFTV